MKCPKIAIARSRKTEVKGRPFAREKPSGWLSRLLRLSDSAANTAVAAFTSLAKATVPKLVKS